MILDIFKTGSTGKRGLVGLLFILIAFHHAISHSLEYIPTRIGTVTADTTFSWLGKTIIPIGDQNGDGYPDLMTGDLRAKLFFYPGGESVSSTPFLVIDSTSYFSLLDDFTGDGIREIAAACRSTCNWKMNVYYGGQLLDTTRDLWFGWDTLAAFGHAVAGGDINASGSNEIIAQSGDFGFVLLCELNPSDSIPDLMIKPQNLLLNTDYVTFGDNIEARDFNGDGRLDVAILFRPPFGLQKSGEVWIYFGEPQFDTIPDVKLVRPGGYVDGSDRFGKVMTCPGDLNGDGCDDLFVNSEHSGDDILSYIFFGGTIIDSLPGMTITPSINGANPAGDVNDDGYDDLICSYSGPFSGVGEVYIFMGGPSFDSIPDVKLFNWDYPGFRVLFGLGATGVGDYNNDGVDDFAFAADNSDNVFEIYIYSGWKSSSGVGEGPATLPKSSFLSQNYPNPFNPSTTIDFSLARSGQVELIVYNILGEAVDTLVNGFMHVGTHTVTWNPSTSRQSSVASGVYFYRLQGPDLIQSKKMLLLK